MQINEILEAARKRAQQLGVPYEGALEPREAQALRDQAPDVKLVDVRSRAELDWVGRIPGAVEIELLRYPGNQTNPDFVKQLEQQVDKNNPVLFICRSGGRSHNAAMLALQAGYAEAYNVLEGFEGDKDASGHRNTVGGWRAAGLPWVQS
jgi:rhodanese-related sulfurtransferase